MPFALDVQWGDQDAYGHVNNCVFAKYAESARVDFFRQLTEPGPQSMMPVVASLKFTFKKPVVFPDRLQVQAHVGRVGSSSVTIVQQMTSEVQQVVVCEVETVLVFVDLAKMQPVPIPAQLREALTRMTTV